MAAPWVDVERLVAFSSALSLHGEHDVLGRLAGGDVQRIGLGDVVVIVGRGSAICHALRHAWMHCLATPLAGALQSNFIDPALTSLQQEIFCFATYFCNPFLRKQAMFAQTKFKLTIAT